MKQKLLLLFACLGFALFSSIPAAFSQGVTTASLNGTVTDQGGNGLEGATVIAVHTPSGTTYGVISRENGQYNLPNVRVGGPYTITASFVGLDDDAKEEVYLKLGEKRNVSFRLVGEGFELEEVVISSGRNSVLNSERTGAETNLGEAQIAGLPTVSRDITDFTRLTPQSTLTEDADGELGFSVGGQNNRFNSIFFDGAISNDVFGLTDQGTNGGQAGVSPISLDAIEQFNIMVAPYDVTLGGFSGGAVNAVTRSGSNNFEGSAYYLWRNETIAGKTPTDNEMTDDNPSGVERTRLADFSSRIYGIRLGGPIIKNKLFFFVNAELEDRVQPQPAPFSILGDSIVGYDGQSSYSELLAFQDKLINDYGYDPGGFINNEKRVDAEKFLIKLTANLNDKNSLTTRYSFSRGRAQKVNPSDRDNINFNNSFEYFPSTTHSAALELSSMLSDNMANSLVLGYTGVRDDRDPLPNEAEGAFPRIEIDDNGADIFAGAEAFSTANILIQDVFTLTDNFNFYKGKHSFTFGTHNEFYSIFNLFVRQNYGVYEYNSLSDFMNGAPPATYIRSYSLLDLNADGSADGLVGDDIQNAAADFNAMQLGFYAQDEIQVSPKFNLTAGLRVDIPMFLTNPPEDKYFNTVTVDSIEKYHPGELQGARAGQMPSSQLMFSPRVGFNWDVTGDRTTQVRGGIGLFTSRLPLVWPGGMHTNNGLSVGGVFTTSDTLANGQPVTFQPDVNNQYTLGDFGGTDRSPSGQMDLFIENMKFPQLLRASVAVDQQLPWGMVGSLEGIFSKNINTVVYKNLNLKPSVENLDGADNRPYFNRSNSVDNTYTYIILGQNTSMGYSYSFTAQLQKAFGQGLSGIVAYTYGDSKAVNDLTSSQNSTQWRNLEVVNGKNAPDLSRSDFSMGSRFLAGLSYYRKYADHFATTISLYYNGQSGEPFSYTYGGSQADRLTNQDSRDFTDLLYIPASASEIEFKDMGTAAQQWADLDAYIEQDPYLSKHRGEYAERNGARSTGSHIIDLRFLQDFYLEAGGKEHRLQFSVDIFNFTNLLNKNWGRRYRTNFNGVELVTFQGFEDRGEGPLTPTFAFNAPRDKDGNISTKSVFTIDDVGTLSSRWQMQFGLRYIFE